MHNIRAFAVAMFSFALICRVCAESSTHSYIGNSNAYDGAGDQDTRGGTGSGTGTGTGTGTGGGSGTGGGQTDDPGTIVPTGKWNISVSQPPYLAGADMLPRTEFSAADKSAAEKAASRYQGVYNVAFDGGTLSVSVGKKGKAKVSGTVNGNKVSATSQLVVGKDAAVVPVVITKKVNMAFCLWVRANGKVEVRGIEGAIADRPSTLKAGAKFGVGGAAGVRALPRLYGEYLPNGIDVAASRTKWIVAGGVKAGKVAFVKGGNTVDESKLGKNPSGLKLTYKQKDGTFKGSFKAYNLEGNDKIKAYTANVTGVMIGAKGYGTATIKKPACTFLVTIE